MSSKVNLDRLFGVRWIWVTLLTFASCYLLAGIGDGEFHYAPNIRPVAEIYENAQGYEMAEWGRANPDLGSWVGRVDFVNRTIGIGFPFVAQWNTRRELIVQLHGRILGTGEADAWRSRTSELMNANAESGFRLDADQVLLPDIRADERVWSGFLLNILFLALCLLFAASLATYAGRGIRAMQTKFRRANRRSRFRSGRCPACGYDIRDLPQPRCPECGAMWGDEGVDRADA